MSVLQPFIRAAGATLFGIFLFFSEHFKTGGDKTEKPASFYRSGFLFKKIFILF